MNAHTAWSFETANFRVALEVSECLDDPADHFSMDEDVEAVRNGDVLWFDASVVVSVYDWDRRDYQEIGRDSLGCCSYYSVDDFVSGHRDADPMNRNCSLMRAARGGNVVMMHYFPSMVVEAIGEARKRVDAIRFLPIHA